MSSTVASSGRLEAPLHLQPMCIADIDAVHAIEQSAYPFPWTRGNFMDSLASGYRCRILRDDGMSILGYFLVMMAVDEAHLLNITVMPALQGRGLGRMLLDHAADISRQEGMHALLLEVRPSNPRAIRMYERYGFSRIGMRRGYYPAEGNVREDAIVMRISL